MRGAPFAGQLSQLASRIIPADAGSTRKSRNKAYRYRDHPRGCGEHGVRRQRGFGCMGSSPRMRGAHLVTQIVGSTIGIIPADAGSTEIHIARYTGQTDHPRGCGEHPSDQTSFSMDKGSSPRMRGALAPANLDPDVWGIIPADAGSTFLVLQSLAQRTDHPRGCGEHRARRALVHWWRGSSPRMRGAPAANPSNSTTDGIIPADAGSTGQLGQVSGSLWDHPRGCGEHCPMRPRLG